VTLSARSTSWVAVGPRAARDLAAAAGDAGAPEAAADVPTALLALAMDGRRPTLVDASMLLPRPRAALRALSRAAAPEEVAVLEDKDLREAVRIARAADEVGVRRVATAEAVFHPLSGGTTSPRSAVAPGRRPKVPGSRRAAARRETTPAGSPADAARPALHPVGAKEEAAFADGCFRRLDRPEALCRFTLRGFAAATGARRLSLMLFESSRSALFLKAAKGLDPALVGRVRTPAWSGLAGRVATLGRALVGRAERGGERAYRGTAYVVLPLGRGSACEGAVALTDFPKDRLPSRAALRSLLRMASRAGRAILAARRLEAAEALSTTDELTQIPNRRSFERALQRELERARRSGGKLAVALLDVDEFKQVNDRYGHPAGDRVLAQIARRLRLSFRDTDLVCRWGGEEFAVLLPELAEGTPEEVLAILERARHAVGARPITLGPGLPSPMVSVSGGLALYPADGRDAAELLRRADSSLYEAKRAGRDRVLHG
jgi:diguanylate cyclase (GGDEF)-like protein